MPRMPSTASRLISRNSLGPNDLGTLRESVRSGATSAAELRSVLDHFGDRLSGSERNGLSALIGGASRSSTPVSTLSQAPGLLNGSVVLPGAGRRHASVGVLQGALNTLAERRNDRSLSPGKADGAWGSATEGAVRSFQRGAGLPADGVVGSKTAKALDAALRSGNLNPMFVNGATPIGGSPSSAAQPDAVAAAAKDLVANYGESYGVDDPWYNLDPNHALPANVQLGGLKGAWKCNLFAGNALHEAGFEPPFYGNRGRGEYPNANQFYKWSDKYAEKFGNKVHFEMVGEVDIEGLPDSDSRRAAIEAVLQKAQPGDLLMVDHLGAGVADGGHTRIITVPMNAEGVLEAAQASSDKARVKTHGVGTFTGEETLWILRPNRPVVED
jgi:peptidoglycan hydrolase-like protein with peptidoglycan-binding domain